MTYYIVAFVIIGVISLIGTIFAGIQINKSMGKLDQVGEEGQEELLKKDHFKTHSSNLRVLTWIYVVVFLLAIVFFLLYLFLK
ncbi:hypothetical protein GCM10011391_23460 [Pullulanibacillus camelliae]|uniref:Uncharacterized protein n=1 Tax=Pullulanibacillus camelliae TaxID=1707096 RepID=A0A8J3DUT1_9BACL|nr:DUF5362 family protein [Pullulanibacillus camelliae]GGE43953.1 hypothetical protein GCM10011391_23460 [Pullulanibacillus camelliae]